MALATPFASCCSISPAFRLSPSRSRDQSLPPPCDPTLTSSHPLAQHSHPHVHVAIIAAVPWPLTSPTVGSPTHQHSPSVLRFSVPPIQHSHPHVHEDSIAIAADLPCPHTSVGHSARHPCSHRLHQHSNPDIHIWPTNRPFPLPSSLPLTQHSLPPALSPNTHIRMYMLQSLPICPSRASYCASNATAPDAAMRMGLSSTRGAMGRRPLASRTSSALTAGRWLGNGGV